MFVTVQLPIIDVRPLVDGNTYRDPRPNWPVPARRFSRGSRDHHRSDYVRGLGAVRPRLRGGVPPWLSESSYVDVRNRVRVGRPEWFDTVSAKVAYRNFYTDGIVGRLEVCFAYQSWDGRADTVTLYATQAPTWFRRSPQNHVPLMDFGPRFADFMLAGTTVGDPMSTGSVLGDELLAWWDLQRWVVRAGEPAVILETPGAEGDDASVNQRWQITDGTRLATWILAQGDADHEEMRRLKTHVSRMHVGFLAAETVLGLCVNGKLDPNHPPVERFLVSTLDTLLRARRHGFGNADLLGMVIGRARDVYWDTVATLQNALALIDNDRIRSRVTEYHELVARAMDPTRPGITIDVKELVMTKYESNISGGVFHGPVNTGSGGAHQHNAASLAEALEQLRAAVASTTLPPEDAVTAEDAAEGLSREADRTEEERRGPGILARLSSLTDVATRAGGAGTALAAAVTAVRVAFGL